MDIGQCWEDCMITESHLRVAQLSCFECVFAAVIHVLVRLGGVVVLVMFVAGGFKYLTAGGDPKKAQAAQQTITHAVIGIALMILAWFILWFIERFTGIPVTEFRIGT